MRQTQVTYTKEEVAFRNGKANTDIWIIIDNFVYDVTSYIHEHPGGADLILEWAGKDATKEFESIGHSSEASRALKNLRIGVLAQNKGQEMNQSPYIEDQTAKNEKSKSGNGKRKRRPLLLFCA
uniref:CSON014748 protein n=1 Tax=Culicoides sonorensis TaxID=179676 RepID=A0A336KRC4_CULSO